METVTSRDGTPIAYDLAGYGPPVIFASGVFNDHTTCAPLAELLEKDHTVVTYDRRGPGRPSVPRRSPTWSRRVAPATRSRSSRPSTSGCRRRWSR